MFYMWMVASISYICVSPSWFVGVAMRVVLSTYVSPNLWIVFPVELAISKIICFVLTNQRIVSRVAAHIASAVQLPWPTPTIHLIVFDVNVLVATPCPVFYPVCCVI